MRIAALLMALAWTGCAPRVPQPSITPAAEPRSVKPTLVSLTAATVATPDRLAAFVSDRLPTLAHCTAYVASFQAEGLVGEPYLLRDPDALDDRMEVRLTLSRDEEGTQLETRVLSGAASDFDCVEDTIGAWRLSEGELAAFERALPGTLVYRFKASAEEREAQRREAEAGLERLCAAYARSPPPGEETRPYLAIREQLAPRLRLKLDRMARALETVPKESPDRLRLFGAAMNGLAAQWGFGSRCTLPGTDDAPAPAPRLSSARQHFSEDAAALRTARRDSAASLVAITTRAGVSGTELERMVRANLSQLTDCIAFSRERAGTLEKLEPSGDDLVSVVIDAERSPELDDRPSALDLLVKVSPRGWSDGGCVTAVVSSWEFPLPQLEAMASLPMGPQPAVQFSYRFRPAVEAKARLRRANAQALAPLCEAYRRVGPSSPKPEDVALSRLAELPPLLRPFVRAAARAVSMMREGGQAADIPWVWADSWREIELMAGVETPCPAFAAWPTRRARPAE